MAKTTVWQGGAEDLIAQVDFGTPASVEVDDIFTMTLTGEDGRTNDVTFTATEATVQNVVEGLLAAWDLIDALDDNLWSEVTLTEDDDKVIVTANTAGIPFHLTCTETDGGGTDDQTFVRSSSVANSGPNDTATAFNWSNGLPVAGDTIKVGDSNYAISQGLAEIPTGMVLFETAKGSKTVIGFKDSYLEIESDAVVLRGEGRAFLDLSGLTGNVQIQAAARDASDGTHGVNIRGTNVSADFEISLGAGQSVGILDQPGDSGNYSDVKASGSGIIYVGEDAGITLIESDGPTVYCYDDSVVTLTIHNGTIYVLGGAPTTVNLFGGTQLIWLGTGTITNLNMFDQSIFDASQDPQSKIVTNCDVYSQEIRIIDPNDFVTWTNGWDLNGVRLSEGMIQRKPNKNWADTAL